MNPDDVRAAIKDQWKKSSGFEYKDRLPYSVLLDMAVKRVMNGEICSVVKRDDFVTLQFDTKKEGQR